MEFVEWLSWFMGENPIQWYSGYFAKNPSILALLICFLAMIAAFVWVAVEVSKEE